MERLIMKEQRDASARLLLKSIYIFVIVTLSVTLFESHAFSDTSGSGRSVFNYEKREYIVLKAGIYTPTSNALEGFDIGFNGEVAVGHYFNPYFASELSAGYFTSSYSDRGNRKFDLWVVPVTLALKAIYPVGKFELYALGGVGAYFANAKLDNSDYSNATALGSFLGGGANLNFDRNWFFDNTWFIGVEGKYLWARPSFNFRGTDVSANIDGWIVTGNIGYKF
jgi:outer membrane protein W